MFNIDFVEKGLRIVFPPYFAYDFSRKIMLYSIDWPNSIVWLPLILGNLLLEPSVSQLTISQYMNEKSKQKFKFLENEKSFKVK